MNWTAIWALGLAVFCVLVSGATHARGYRTEGWIMGAAAASFAIISILASLLWASPPAQP